VGIAGGRIAAVATPGTLTGGPVEDVTGLYVLPGVVDPHAHIGFGGGTDEYAPDTRAALLGGTTSVFYILIHAGAYVPQVRAHLEHIAQSSYVDVGLHLTLMTDEHLTELEELASLGVRSFKYYMSFRGEEGAYLGVTGTDDGAFYAILEAVAKINGVLAIHPENIEVVWRLRDRVRAQGRDDLKAWGLSRPQFTEAEAVARAAYLAGSIGTQLYLVHLSGTEAVAALRSVRQNFPNLTVYGETCPHFLTHHEDMDLGVVGKVNPPLRTAADNDYLWQAITDGTLDTVGSDHVARKRAAKAGTIWQASAGFPGMATILPVLITEGHLKRGIPLSRLVAVASKNPAQIFGVGDRKGDIRVGLDADLVVVDLEQRRPADPTWLGSYADYSLYEDWPLAGWPRLTYLRGRLVQRDGVIVDEQPGGVYLPRNA
jgi:dihydropyrimidinase